MEAAFPRRAVALDGSDEIRELAETPGLPPRHRAWKLIEHARALHADGDPMLALLALDAAVDLDDSPELTAAAHTLALAINREGGRPKKRVASRLLRLRARVYWEYMQYRRTESARSRWRRAADAVAAAERR